MKIKKDIRLMKRKGGLIAIGNRKCWRCGCITAKRGMTVHHLWYLKNNDIIYKKYPKNESGSLQYYTELYQKVVKNPKRFMYLCNTHHFTLEKFCRFGDKIYNKISIARKMTKT